MKVILDTNVFVSGVFFSGPPFRILQAWRAGKFTLILSADILDEYRRLGEILAGEFPGIDLEPVIEFVEQNAVALTVPPLAEGVSDDPDDDKFIACALAGRCEVIVSGDKHLLKVSGYREIDIMKPRSFLDRHLRENIK